MKTGPVLCVCLLVLLALASAGGSQDEKPPDYSSKTLGQWLEAMKNQEDELVRIHARMALGPRGPYAKLAVPALIEAFNQKNPPPLWDAAQTIADYGPNISPVLLRELKKPNAAIRALAAKALGSVRPRAVEAIHALIEAMRDPVPEVRASATESVGSTCRQLELSIPPIVRALRDPNEEVREAAASVLEKLGRKVETSPASINIGSGR